MKPLYIIVLFALFGFINQCEAKTWHSVDGKRNFDAEIVSYQSPNVTVKLPDGKLMSFNIAVLNVDDQRYCVTAGDVLSRSLRNEQFTVTQTLKDGLLCDDTTNDPSVLDGLVNRTPMEQMEFNLKLREAAERADPSLKLRRIFVLRGVFKTVADGDKFNGDLFFAGNYAIRKADGSTITVRSFTSDLDSAIKAMLK
jgi:hypothetical protein